MVINALCSFNQRDLVTISTIFQSTLKYFNSLSTCFLCVALHTGILERSIFGISWDIVLSYFPVRHYLVDEQCLINCKSTPFRHTHIANLPHSDIHILQIYPIPTYIYCKYTPFRHTHIANIPHSDIHILQIYPIPTYTYCKSTPF